MTSRNPVSECTRHPGKGFVYVCGTCNNALIVLDRHNKRDLDRLTEYVSRQKTIIQQYEASLFSSCISKVESDIQAAGENFKENGNEFSETIDHIRHQGDRIKREIDKRMDRLVKVCKNLEKMNSDIKERNDDVLTEYLREKIKPQLGKGRSTQTSGTKDDVIEVAEEFPSDIPTNPPTITAMKWAIFKPGIISNTVLNRMLGTLYF